jgi:hypothetical protein
MRLRSGDMNPKGNLPNFFIIGAMRSGTTSLFSALEAHPEVFVAPGKELRFFDLRYERGIDWYQERFRGSDGRVAIGEASQTYMYDPIALERMAAHLPKARLIAILRDPVERAYSHYWLNRSRGREPLSFQEALEAEPERLERPSVTDRFYFSYTDRGRYLVQLDRVCSLYDRSDLHVMLFDDLRDRPVEAFEGVCRFLGVDERAHGPALGTPVNAYQGFRSLRLRALTKQAKRRGWGNATRVMGALNRRRDSYPSMPPDVRGHLGEVFREGNLALAKWLARDLSAWSGMAAEASEAARSEVAAAPQDGRA